MSSAASTQPAAARRRQEEHPISLGCLLSCFTILAVSAGTFAMYYFPSVRAFYGTHRDLTLKWWQRSIIYQVYPRSFQDTNGDGVGDINGVIERLDYFSYLGIEAIWLNPIYSSPMLDMGYDVSDHKQIDPTFGSMADFETLVEKAHDRDVKVIMDFIPNHTSDKHKWFQESCKKNGGKYQNYYIWADGVMGDNGTVLPPNNWVSVFGGSMWQWHQGRGQYYLHQFLKEQPDLNFRNPQVQQEMKDVLRFWIEKGVDGFRVDAARHLFEVQDLSLNEPMQTDAPQEEGYYPDYDHYTHMYTQDLKETHDIMRDWRKMFEEIEDLTGKEIFLAPEVFGPLSVALPYYHSGASFPFNFNLQSVNASCDGYCLKELVDELMKNIPEGKWPNWVLGSHDVPRVSAKMEDKYIAVMNMLQLTLPGTPVTYYGEELGLKPIKVPFEETKDSYAKNMGPARYESVTRDPSRGPMQWMDSQNAGFSTAEHTWLPVNSDYTTRNVRTQMNEPSSILSQYKQLAELRKIQSFTRGGFRHALVNKNIFSFTRYYQNEPAHLVAINIGDSPSSDDYREYKNELPPSRVHAPYRGYVVANTGNMKDSKLEVRSVLTFDEITLHPGEGVVIRYWPAMTYL